MRALVVAEPGGPEALRVAEVERPRPEPGEILVRVRASGVNRADVLQRLGRYPAPAGAAANVPGLEYAGVVDRTGEGVDTWNVGDRVMGIVAGGGYAEYVRVRADHAIAIPQAWTFADAAAFPETFITAYDALFRLAGLRRGERVLVHAVGSGVGIAVLQLAKAHGCVVAGTSRTPEKLVRAAELGLDYAISVVDVFAPAPAFEQWAHVVCDLVGGPYMTGNLTALAPRGRLVIVGLTGGRSAEVDLGRLMTKRLTVVGTVLRSRSAEEKRELIRAFTNDVLPLVESGAVRPVLDRSFAAERAPEAHRYMEAHRNFGSIVLTW